MKNTGWSASTKSWVGASFSDSSTFAPSTPSSLIAMPWRSSSRLPLEKRTRAV